MMRGGLASTVALLALVPESFAHMGFWAKSMYGVGPNFQYSYGDPGAPVGPNWEFNDWWFRGAGYRALTPQDGAVSILPAGGTFTTQIACHIAWTSLGWSTTPEDYPLNACPGNSGAYHAGIPGAPDIDLTMVAGCALAIADVDDIEKATMDNLVVFSVQKECVTQRTTSFQVPARMPPCTGSKCICAWLWLASNGTGNFYMTGFDCQVTGSPADATPIGTPKDPTWCPPDGSQPSCVTQSGPKRPLYAYNTPTNVVWQGNYDRPSYKPHWSFNDGPQDDIFLPAGSVASSAAASSGAKSSGAAAATSAGAFSGTAVVQAGATTTQAANGAEASASAASSAAATTTKGRHITNSALASRLATRTAHGKRSHETGGAHGHGHRWHDKSATEAWNEELASALASAERLQAALNVVIPALRRKQGAHMVAHAARLPFKERIVGFQTNELDELIYVSEEEAEDRARVRGWQLDSSTGELHYYPHRSWDDLPSIDHISRSEGGVGPDHLFN
ncbi:hypothetical protein T439DRAFT_327255 [Meredithblackwellia eburnea MCA 4105]